MKIKPLNKEKKRFLERWLIFQGIGFAYLMLYYNKVVGIIIILIAYFLYEHYFNKKDLNIKLYR